MDQKIVQDKIQRLTKYVEDLKTRRNGYTSETARTNPEGFKRWLEREIDVHTKKIEDLRRS